MSAAAGVTFHVGDLAISRIPEIPLSFAPEFMLPGWRADDAAPYLDRMVPGSFDDSGGHMILSTHSWLLRSPRHTILIDTGIGNDKERSLAPFNRLNTPFLARLAQAGVSAEQIDYVVLTHLHTDHVGWNTRLDNGRWVPTFPNARYIFSRAEYNALAALSGTAACPPYFADSVQPIVAADRAVLIESGPSGLIDGLVMHPTPGHSIDHLSISVSSRGETALFAGDVLHHPIQIHLPQLNSVFCRSPDHALTSRHWALAFAADNDALFLSSHFAESSAGRVARNDDGYSWTFA
jgi:glyoxylase-like metal-dependent hydrolase (beta-lactamase superfamily II)